MASGSTPEVLPPVRRTALKRAPVALRSGLWFEVEASE